MVTVSTAPGEARDRWERAGAEVLVLDDPEDARRVSVAGVMSELGKRDVQTVLIEGGSTLAWSAVEAGVVDRLVLYLAPRLVGGTAAPGVLGGDGVATIAGALPIAIRSVERTGEDVKVVADVHRDR